MSNKAIKGVMIISALFLMAISAVWFVWCELTGIGFSWVDPFGIFVLWAVLGLTYEYIQKKRRERVFMSEVSKIDEVSFGGLVMDLRKHKNRTIILEKMKRIERSGGEQKKEIMREIDSLYNQYGQEA